MGDVGLDLSEYYEKYLHICGIDEVGRGCLAGPVVACSLVMPKGSHIEGIKDSKKLSAKKRETLDKLIREEAVAIGLGAVSPEVIDEINIKQASRLAMKNALESMVDRDGKIITPDFVLIDAEKIDTSLPQLSILHGDDLCYVISCASIVAKVYRDQMFTEYEERYPGYSFLNNKGYGTKAHIEGLLRQGITPIHRKTFLKKWGY